VLIDVGVDEVTEDRRRYWKVFVADHGPGIDDSFKNAVFERFKQGPATSTGTGLGLHIAKALVENYKGRIWVENRVQGDSSKGSVFNVLLPKSDGPAQVG
jgi:signal transduction histidine kinase